MPSNDGDTRRNTDGPEDNPFIAFRRFADSQVSSLLNTVFTLPATLANYNNAYHAREQCLFGNADQVQCAALQDIENKVADIRSEGRELYRVGDIQAMLAKGEELMALDREADALRKTIVEQTRSSYSEGSADEVAVDNNKKQAVIVEKVANKKGQEWGWDWSWGFPKPFDAEDNQLTGDRNHCRWRERRERWYRARRERNEEGFEQCRRNRWAQKEDAQHEINDNEEGSSFSKRHQPKVWSWSFSWPPPADAQPEHSAGSERSKPTFEELGNMLEEEFSRMMTPKPVQLYMDPYTPSSIEKDEVLNRAGIQWRDAFEDLARAERGEDLMPKEQLGASSHLPYEIWARRFWREQSSFEELARHTGWTRRLPFQWMNEEESEEPSYEYGHDHEDQHDDPPTPKLNQGQVAEKVPTTELEAYERLLGPAVTPIEPTDAKKSSILSTLTTTERTVAPDGTVTTKVVLKKRFTDGREESSETVHTQRGQETEGLPPDPWNAVQEAQFSSSPNRNATREQPSDTQEPKKRNGWFWSN